MMFIRLNSKGKSARRGVVRIFEHGLFVDVVRSFAVTIVVEINLYQSLRILTQTREHPQYNRLLFQCRCTHLQDRDEDLVQKNLNLFL